MSEDKTPDGYLAPVSALLTLGSPKGHRNVDDWPDYVTGFGFTSEHIPELGRLALDSALWEEEYWERPEITAYVHAYRVLGQLRDEAAIPYLIQIIDTEEDSDWVLEEISYAVSLIGPAAIPMLKESLERAKENLFIGMTVVDCFEKMGLIHPETKAECIAILTAKLEKAEGNDPGINGSIVATLVIDFKAKEALPVIEKAFAGNYVDEMIMGDWYDVQVEFGLKAPDPNRKRPLNPLAKELLESIERLTAVERAKTEETKKRSAQLRAVRSSKSKQKAKRKKAKKQRKQNRKRKK
jgi:hypothetical protein